MLTGTSKFVWMLKSSDKVPPMKEMYGRNRLIGPFGSPLFNASVLVDVFDLVDVFGVLLDEESPHPIHLQLLAWHCSGT